MVVGAIVVDVVVVVGGVVVLVVAGPVCGGGGSTTGGGGGGSVSAGLYWSARRLTVSPLRWVSTTVTVRAVAS